MLDWLFGIWFFDFSLLFSSFVWYLSGYGLYNIIFDIDYRVSCAILY